MNKQLEKDITNKFDERIKQACKDHIDLCQVADIDPKTSLSILLAVLGSFLTSGIAEFLEMTPEIFGESMAQALRIARSKKASA